jgi:hypothetical protein
MQENLRQVTANFFAAQGCKIPCMQLGQIVAELMKQEGLSLSGVAERVRAQGAHNVKHQHIQQLIEFPNRRPRYLPELARAFGFTVEQLMAWRPGDIPNRVQESSSVYGSMSHDMRSGLERMASTVKLLQYIVEIQNGPPEALHDPYLLTIAHEIVSEAGEAVTDSNLIEFSRRFAARQREREINDGTKRKSTSGTGGDDLGAHGRTASGAGGKGKTAT